ncbi:MAG: hypothetical protein ACF8GE_09695 [Phycisphaerales bacterium JB043]
MFTFLAQDSASVAETSSPMLLIETIVDSKWDLLTRPADLMPALDNLGVVWSVIFLLLGLMCVLNGYRWHKGVIMVLALMCGAAIGHVVGDSIGITTAVTAIAGACLFGVIAWPVMRFTVALFAGLAGAFCGSNLWSAIGQDPTQHYIGAMIGLLLLGMLAFITFKIVIVAFTAIGGASLTVFGMLGLLLQLEAWRGGLQSELIENPLVIPVIVGSAAIFGMVYQQGGGVKGLKESADSASAQGGAKGKPQQAAAA